MISKNELDEEKKKSNEIYSGVHTKRSHRVEITSGAENSKSRPTILELIRGQERRRRICDPQICWRQSIGRW